MRILCLIIIILPMVFVPARAANNVLIVTLDGLRWQELFHGIDKSLLETEANIEVREAMLARYDANSSEEKRKKLMPFMWTEIANKGVLIGDRLNGSSMSLTNHHWFSYPGYNEILTGKADNRITSNAREHNQNKTILEYLHNQSNHVAAFGSWDVFPYILNTQRNDFLVNAGFTSANWANVSEQAQWLSQLQAQIPSPWHSVRLDAFTYGFASEYIEQHQPNVIYVALGETDDFAHDGDYVQYLQAANRSDQFIQALWERLQSMKQYAGNTHLLITTDHGRGTSPASWVHHASPESVNGYMSSLKKQFPNGITGANEVWFAGMGPNITPKGVFASATEMFLDQFAATVLHSLDISVSDFATDIGNILPVFRSEQITPVDTEKTLTKIGFGSCLKENKPQPLWDDVLARQPDLFVLMGDNVYGDTEDMNELKGKYQQLSAQTGFKKLRQTTPIIGIWDDHDYGQNDAGAEYPKKEESKHIMLDFFGEPKNSERRMREDGAYTSYMFGPEGRRVHIILPDLRYNRTPLDSVGKLVYGTQREPFNQGPYKINQAATATMLGETQWQWLEEELAKPADIKILVSSLQVIADFTGWESWTNFAHDQARLYNNIERLNLDNLIIVSGDTHWSEISRRTMSNVSLVDMTASGMTEKWKDISPNQYRESDAFAMANFGMLTIDWSASPTNAMLEIITKDGEILIQQAWRP